MPNRTSEPQKAQQRIDSTHVMDTNTGYHTSGVTQGAKRESGKPEKRGKKRGAN
jgi:hypothetical protein